MSRFAIGCLCAATGFVFGRLAASLLRALGH